MAVDQELHVVLGTGPIGLAAIEELVKSGQRVRAVNRHGKAGVPAGVEVVAADITDPAQAVTACAGASAIYNCTNPPAYQGWTELLPRLQTGILAGAESADGAKLIVMDNVYMYGNVHGKPMTEDMPNAATTKKGALRARIADNWMAAHNAGRVRVIVARASDYFGPNGRGSGMGDVVFGRAVQGKSAQVIGNPDMPHTYTYIPDIGKALVILGARDEAVGEIWHVPSPPTITTRAFIERIGQALGHPVKIQVAPTLLIRAMGLFQPVMRELVEMVYEFNEPFILDHSKFAAAFGDISTPLDEAIAATAAWFKEHSG
jgi:nucleoside-diphosphate-sugar epimerase